MTNFQIRYLNTGESSLSDSLWTTCSSRSESLAVGTEKWEKAKALLEFNVSHKKKAHTWLAVEVLCRKLQRRRQNCGQYG